jgi:hypothetical protein
MEHSYFKPGGPVPLVLGIDGRIQMPLANDVS